MFDFIIKDMWGSLKKHYYIKMENKTKVMKQINKQKSYKYKDIRAKGKPFKS